MSSRRTCPTCRAPWRAAASCARCGTDLLPLMRLVLRAHASRETARRAVVPGGGRAGALRIARRAHRLEATPRSAALLMVAAFAAGEREEGLRAFREVVRLSPSGGSTRSELVDLD